MPEFVVRTVSESVVEEVFNVEARNEQDALEKIVGKEPFRVEENNTISRNVRHRFPDEVEGEG